MKDHRSKWRLFGKLILICILIQTCEGQSSDENAPDQEEAEEAEQEPEQEPEAKEYEEEPREEGDEPPPPPPSGLKKKKKGKSKGFREPAIVGKSKSFKNVTGFSYGFSTSEKKSDKWKSFGGQGMAPPLMNHKGNSFGRPQGQNGQAGQQQPGHGFSAPNAPGPGQYPAYPSYPGYARNVPYQYPVPPQVQYPGPPMG